MLSSPFSHSEVKFFFRSSRLETIWAALKFISECAHPMPMPASNDFFHILVCSGWVWRFWDGVSINGQVCTSEFVVLEFSASIVSECHSYLTDSTSMDTAGNPPDVSLFLYDQFFVVFILFCRFLSSLRNPYWQLHDSVTFYWRIRNISVSNWAICRFFTCSLRWVTPFSDTWTCYLWFTWRSSTRGQPR